MAVVLCVPVIEAGVVIPVRQKTPVMVMEHGLIFGKTAIVTLIGVVTPVQRI